VVTLAPVRPGWPAAADRVPRSEPDLWSGCQRPVPAL